MLRRIVTSIWPRNAKHRAFSAQIKHITGFRPGNLVCYEQALRHHSVSKTIHHNGSRDSNERLEFLGDAVLNAVIADYLFKKYPFQDEGFLTQLRSKIVSRESLNELAIKIQLNQLVVYDKRSMQNLNIRNSIFGNALEAFLGAVYLDGGFETCRDFILEKLLRYHVDVDKLQVTETNFKGRLIEQGQKNGQKVEFEVDEKLDGKQKLFIIRVLIEGETKGTAEHTNKKKAEQMASQRAMETLQALRNDSQSNQLETIPSEENQDN